jgi:hypothetical protein
LLFLVELDGAKVKFIKAVNEWVLLFESWHKLSSKILTIEFIIFPFGSNGLGPIVGQLFFISIQPALIK